MVKLTVVANDIPQQLQKKTTNRKCLIVIVWFIHAMIWSALLCQSTFWCCDSVTQAPVCVCVHRVDRSREFICADMYVEELYIFVILHGIMSPLHLRLHVYFTHSLIFIEFDVRVKEGERQTINNTYTQSCWKGQRETRAGTTGWEHPVYWTRKREER